VTLDEARRSFPGLSDKVFLDAACVSLVPRQARDAIRAFVDEAMLCTADDASLHHIDMDARRRETVEAAAVLLRTDTSHIALVESTTHGLNIAANAIRFERGDRVLVADTEFLQVAIPWARKARAGDIAIAPVPSREGALAVGDFERAMDQRTKAVCVSSVQWSSGHRVDVRSLGRLCRDRGIWLVVDAIQEMGALTIDLSDPWADFVIAGGHKWLNAPFGCGVMYVGDRVLDELEPASWGYLALAEPDGGWETYFGTPDITPYRGYEFPRMAKRFEIGGTSNYPGAIALTESLKLVNALGIECAERQVLALAAFARDELRKAGAHLVSNDDPAARSGITTFTYYRDPVQDRALLDRLLRERVLLAMRYTSGIGGIRVSTHYFNDEEDVLRMTAALRRVTGA
jgi:cysteine desulfurase/selenocysteine lyase